METGALECKIAHSAEDSLTTVSWSPDGRRIACGGERGQFYQCDAKNGNVMENKEGVRVQAMAYRKDNKTVLAADKHNRVRSYNLEDETSDKTILSESYGIMNFTIDDSDRFALLTLREQVNTNLVSQNLLVIQKLEKYNLEKRIHRKFPYYLSFSGSSLMEYRRPLPSTPIHRNHCQPLQHP